MSRSQINETVRKQVRQYFTQLTLIFAAFLAGMILFLISVLIVAQTSEPKSQAYDMALLISAPLSSMALLLIAHRLFQARVKRAQTAEKLFEKMDAYRSGMMLRFMLLDGAAFIQLGAFMMTENRIFIAISLVVATLFMLYRPTLARFIRDMALSEVEAQVMRDHASPQPPNVGK